MPRPLRWFVSGQYYFVTNRTLKERCYLRPDEQTNAAVVKSLAVELRYHPVDFIAFVCLGNHYHLVVRAREHSVSDFVGVFQSRLARAVNERLGRRGPVWQRRFVATRYPKVETVDARLAA